MEGQGGQRSGMGSDGAVRACIESAYLGLPSESSPAGCHIAGPSWFMLWLLVGLLLILGGDWFEVGRREEAQSSLVFTLKHRIIYQINIM